MSATLTKVKSRPCFVCGKSEVFDVPTEGLENWKKGMAAQYAFPDMSTAERELLITGAHISCLPF